MYIENYPINQPVAMAKVIDIMSTISGSLPTTVIVTNGRGSRCEECNSGTQLVTGTAQTITQTQEPIQGSVQKIYSRQMRAYKKETKRHLAFYWSLVQHRL